jgi:hypothetical protein
LPSMIGRQAKAHKGQEKGTGQRLMMLIWPSASI